MPLVITSPMYICKCMKIENLNKYIYKGTFLFRKMHQQSSYIFVVNL